MMVVDQLPHPRGQSFEGQFVPWQNEMFVFRHCLEMFARFKPALDGIGIRFSGVDADIRGNTGDDLVPCDDDIIVARPQRGMFWGVAIADVNVERACSDDYRVALLDAFKTELHWVNDVGIVEWFLGAAFFKDIRRHTSGLIEGDGFRGCGFLVVEQEHPRKQP